MVIATWAISLTAIALVLIRPKQWPEAVWAVAGAVLLVVFRLLPLRAARSAVAKGTDVYLFLTGMMIVSELARREGVFDWIAAYAVNKSRGSRERLFVMIYVVGIVVTVFLSNDATAVVLTPAVLAAVRTAEAEPLPYLLICAFIANAASFVLPISNPANLVVYQGGMPPLTRWLETFALASVASIVLTFAVLRRVATRHLQGAMRTQVPERNLRGSGKVTLGGIGLLAVVLITASALDADLGAPACGCGLFVLLVIGLADHRAWKDVAKGVSWSVLPLVAGLFVIVEALNGRGGLELATHALKIAQTWAPRLAGIVSAVSVALLSNCINNLPSGLITAAAVQTAGVKGLLRDALLVGVDVGPNLSVTGSLATILWLIAIRRDNLHVTFWDFLKWGALVMPPALLGAVLLLRQ